ncbi:hypothetical protein [Parasphingorhabdus sp.]|uniref:hypothetical protein n=1 Tax=Parasphingorhabdus sp. TaxID=2709688 RepID=UPI003592FF88
MSNLSNRPDQFEAIRVAHQASEILRILNYGRSTNSQILRDWLGRIGLGISRRDLQDLLDRLEKEELVRTEEIDSFRVVHLRQLGGEIASGIESLDWIARPEPPA